MGPDHPASYETFKKIRHLSAEECAEALEYLMNPERLANRDIKKVAKVKCRSYLEGLPLGKLELSALAIDKAKSLHIMLFERRRGSCKTGAEVVYADSLLFRKTSPLANRDL